MVTGSLVYNFGAMVRAPPPGPPRPYGASVSPLSHPAAGTGGDGFPGEDRGVTTGMRTCRVQGHRTCSSRSLRNCA